MNFMKEWKQTNKLFINRMLGLKCYNYQFIFGILFAPSSSKQIVPCLQTMIQADTAHLRFCMFKLYSAYGSVANSNTSPIAFAILFGNEDLKEKYPPDSKICYYLDLFAPRKTGRPPNAKRIKWAIEVAMERK